MKHVTSYIFLIMALLLFGVNGAAAQEQDCPFKVSVVEGKNTDISYDNKVLSIRSSENVTITGNGKPTDWGIEIESLATYLRVTIKDLNIERKGVPLKIERGEPGTIIIEGTNRFVSTGSSGTAGIEAGYLYLEGSGSLTAIGAKGANGTGGGAGIGDGSSLTIGGGIIHAEGGAGAPGIGVSDPAEDMTIQIIGGTVTAIGGGGENPAPGIDGGTSSNYPSIELNAFVIAIDGTDHEGNPATTEIKRHSKGLFIRGKQLPGGTIEQTSSALVGNVTLESNAEIPAWATVTIGDGQTFTIGPNVTLTNSGTIYNKGTLTGNPITGNLLYHNITFNANYSSLPAVEKYILQGDALPTDIFTRPDYTFQGWYDVSGGGAKVETIDKPQTLYARWKAVPEPEPEPEPTPIYYTVTLPFVEGAATDPVAGDYEIESWSTFRFYLTLDADYSESQPVVTTSRGETLQPRTSDGAYLVKYVRTDVEIFIDGIVKNLPPVANEPIRAAASEPEIWSEDACLCIRLPEGMPTSPVRIFTPEGRLLDSFRSVPGLNRRQLPTGIYIVQVGATVRKVAVK
ncbi:InlB B-repeat-containing protein [Parabacteroides chongii]|uniref:InlB B-repeat-containing protein n=1 Tax=Parabacteroides chongii TaxID=2685834 RepID=UPI00240DB09C|nr:InlB B-repeat-containing protein [Parabacteroides chongii]WFE84367.1 InlB B-repeat-containing protein [Parabacteroides chongii]